MPGRMALLITILLMLINISGEAHKNTPSSDTFSMIDLWILICIIFVSLALFEYGLVIKIKYSKRGPAAQAHVLDGGRNWTKVTWSWPRKNILSFPLAFQIIDRSSGFIFPIAFVIANAAYGMAPAYSTKYQGINITNYLSNFKQL